MGLLSNLDGSYSNSGSSETVSDEFKNTVLVVGIVWNKEHSAGCME